jgi:hypothetical protein
MKMKLKMEKGDIKSYLKAVASVEVLEKPMIDRIDYIIKTIFKAYGKKFECWYFYDANEGEVGSLSKYLNVQNGWIEYVSEPCREMPYLAEDGSEWDLHDTFPLEWLHEEFETALVVGKNHFTQVEKEKKQAEKEKKQKMRDAVEALKATKKAKAIKSAKDKLTKEEQRALGIG